MGVLDEMTAGITQRKAAKAGPKLTPVGTEASPIKPSIPNDTGVFMSNEELLSAARKLRDMGAQLQPMTDLFVNIADALDELTQQTSVPEVKVDKLAEQKAIEAAADAKHAQPKTSEEFAEHLATISAEAKASTFTGPEPAAPSPVASDEWTCPDHGADNIKTLTKRPSGTTYRACMVEDCVESE